ncbi:MAG: CIA30 family protein, partial [Candidatus Aminicenantes bacterium]
LLIGGTELSLNSGHLAAMGFNIPGYIFPPEPQEAINEIIHDNGVCFISHPFDDKVPWTDWDISGFTGLEVLSSYSAARRAGILKILIFPLKYVINSKYALLNTMGYPTDNVKKWDSLNQSGRYYGIYALDAHAKLPISKKIQLNFPTYKSMFEIMTVYVKINQKLLRGVQGGGFLEKSPPGRRRQAHQAAAGVIASLRKGNFFNVIEGIASANGFEAFFIEKESGKRIEMGGSSKEKQGKLVILLPFDFETEIIVLRDGIKSEQKAIKQKKQLEIEVNEPGVYRIEVYVPGNTFDDLPWIMTNPFFVGVEAPLPSFPAAGEIVLKRLLLDDQDAFKVEKNNRSQGLIDDETREEGEKITHFTFKLVTESPEDKNFWSVMALRKRFDFSGDKGFIFEARSDKKRRFWVEFRTGEGESEVWYRHSFLVEPGWKKFHIPFKKFQVIYGEKKLPQLSKVSSIFFSINNANAYPGTEGEIFLKNFGLY